MAAKDIKSGTTSFDIDGKKRVFKTITTVENGKISNTKIIREIEKTVYDSRNSETPDLAVIEGTYGESDAKYYEVVRTGGGDTIYAELDLRKKFADNKSNGLTATLNRESKKALTEEFSADSEKSTDAYWNKQLSNNDNVARNPGDVLDDIKLSSIEIDPIEGRRRLQYATLYYPEDIVTSKQDRIVFSMFYQSGRDISFDLRSNNILTLGKRKTTPITGSVTLPIPGNLRDSNTVAYSGGRLDPLQAAGFSLAYDPIQGFSNIGDILRNTDVQEALTSTTGTNVLNALRTVIAQNAVGATGTLSRATGAILNPNIELLFQSPELRTFEFNFTLSARSRNEAGMIRRIIRFFKQGMSVKKTASQVFVVSPNQFRVKFKTGDNKDHPSIGRIKDCALVSLNTTYGEGNTYMTFDDPSRTLTSYTLTMRFQEIEPLTEDDYLGEPNTSSGPLADSDDAFIGTNGVRLDNIGF